MSRHANQKLQASAIHSSIGEYRKQFDANDDILLPNGIFHDVTDTRIFAKLLCPAIFQLSEILFLVFFYFIMYDEGNYKR